MDKETLKARSQDFTVQIYHLCKTIPAKIEERELRKQLFRSAASVAANYRAVCRAGSRRAFASKLDICIEECDEVMFWLEFLNRIDLIKQKQFNQLSEEASQLLAIFIQSKKTATTGAKV